MAIATTPLIERVARVLAAQQLSANAGGMSTSAALDVDIEWIDHKDDALAILKALREPDHAMADAGDAAIWERMIAVAIHAGEDLDSSHDRMHR
ncbi:hypothetical protein [Sphingobium lignivorans]|uniref:Uncharacterized protein n=1 Tax=Sphingobium lignivorans TaxID=2735886 RepID=A0ABR6NHY4_9SPHN|nr:hypothetical protein [Sphingobium lignivorans]MBB5986870.1 hypothetical protein [Sphingobium lignivorans]